MSKFKFYFIAFCSAFVLFSCNKSDDLTYEYLRYYGPQYATEKKIIQTFLKTNYIKEIVDNPGAPNDQDVTFELIPNNNTVLQPVWNSPLLDSTKVDFAGIRYTVYYLKLREGSGVNPSRVDEVLTSYDGSYLGWEYVNVVQRNSDGTPIMIGGKEKTEREALCVPYRFEYVQFPQLYFGLINTIQGWREVFPFFKSGTASGGEGPDPVSYNNFGAGVMFIPSALAYYQEKQNLQTGGDQILAIPSYSPLMFKFKLYDVKRADHDGDGVISNDEDLNHDGIFTNDDTDGDGIQDFLDQDDDGDGYSTKSEISYIHPSDPDHTVRYYPYNGAAVDDPATPYVNETYGIPRKFTGPLGMPAEDGSDFTDPTRLRRHLDRTAKPPYPDKN